MYVVKDFFIKLNNGSEFLSTLCRIHCRTDFCRCRLRPRFYNG